MNNIIKSLNYQVRRDIVTYIAIFGGILVAFLPIFEIDAEGIKELNGGMYANQYLALMLLVPYIMSCLIGACVIGKDMGDKTINYEVLSGHPRSQVFWGRVITAFAWDIGLCILVSAVPIALVTLINGWGKNIVFAHFLARYVIIIVGAFRILSFVVLITTVMRHPVAGGFISYGVLNFSTIPLLLLEELFDKKLYHVLAMADIFYLSEFTNMVSMVENGEKIPRYDLSVPSSFFVVSIVVSIAVSAVYLILAYLIFKKRDMR